MGSKSSGTKTPVTRVVTIPAEFLPLIEQERDRQGCFTCTDTMGRILEKYFGKRPSQVAAPSQNGHEKPAIKGVKKDAK